MRGIPQTLMSPLRQALMDCDEFFNPRQLYAIFDIESLKPFQKGLPEADNLKARVDMAISYLSNKGRTNGENALVLLLRVLGDRYNPPDERHDRLITLAEQLEWYKQRSSKPEVSVLEANPEKAQMLWIAEAEKMLKCAGSVARIQVPRYVNNKKQGKGNSGTVWLIAPELALTCWHVVENRGALDAPIDQIDLEEQMRNALLTFDYTVAGKGVQYKVVTLEYPTIESQKLDYAILRLQDRSDFPLQDRGYLQADIEIPLTTQTSLYIIQHPLGQSQQSAGGTFERVSPTAHRILYNTPTEPGTSGAPVFNRANWCIVALHNGENQHEHLREGTLLKPILEEVKHHKPELYDEIMTAQE